MYNIVIDKSLSILLLEWNKLLDSLIHKRISELGFIDLIVSVLSIRDEINDDVLLELAAPFGSDAAHVNDGLRVVGVDVEDGRIDDTRHIRAVGRRAREARRRREADLVVDHDVHGTVSRVCWQVAQMERLEYHALARECRVAVDHHAHYFIALFVVAVELLRASL